MKEAVIASICRTPVGKAYKGALRVARPDDLAAIAIKEALNRVPGLEPGEVEDVILGCAMPEAEQGMNVARIASLRAGIPHTASAVTVNRFCASGLQAIAQAAERIMCGFAQVIVAGGTESMSLVPMGGHKVAPNPTLLQTYPDAYLSMGLTAENLARKYEITREEQDGFAFASHQKAVRAIAHGYFKEETVPVEVTYRTLKNGKPTEEKFVFDTDEGPRRDTSREALAALKPAFHDRGTITAGNASQMSDGASAAVVMSAERARELGIRPLARFVAYATAGVAPEEMGIGPAKAIPKALKLAGLKAHDVDVIELNEAFAAQVLAVFRLTEFDTSKVNPNGGAIALGHPLGCTGSKLTASLLYEMRRRQAHYGMVTMCVGGGMGAAGIFERLD
ncbi:MAG: acetyl-CoA C-acyltransferase [Acidobacteria bacterium]|nr:acetyl-CoA C-acyltransferase [Acidobacteriota bacterium]